MYIYLKDNRRSHSRGPERNTARCTLTWNIDYNLVWPRMWLHQCSSLLLQAKQSKSPLSYWFHRYGWWCSWSFTIVYEIIIASFLFVTDCKEIIFTLRFLICNSNVCLMFVWCLVGDSRDGCPVSFHHAHAGLDALVHPPPQPACSSLEHLQVCPSSLSISWCTTRACRRSFLFCSCSFYVTWLEK